MADQNPPESMPASGAKRRTRSRSKSSAGQLLVPPPVSAAVESKGEPSNGDSTSSVPSIALDVLFPTYAPAAFETQTEVRRAQLIAELRKIYLGDGLALYLGAGTSMSVGLPSWNELIHSLTVSMMSRRVTSAAEALQELTAEQRAEGLKTLLEEIRNQQSAQKPVLMMARALKDQFGDELPSQVATHLYGRLSLRNGVFWRLLLRIFDTKRRAAGDVDELQLPTSELLDAIVQLIRPQRYVAGVQAIINYNYDDILEERLRKESVPCLTVLSGKQKLTRGRIPSYHVHGVLPLRQFMQPHERGRKMETGNFVFSEDEYHSEYADPYRWSNLTQIGTLGRHKGLFVGLSMQDPNLRRLIDVTHRQYPEIWNYAILQRASRSENEDVKSLILKNLAEYVEEDSFSKIGVRVIWVNNIKTDVAPILRQVAHLPEE